MGQLGALPDSSGDGLWLGGFWNVQETRGHRNSVLTAGTRREAFVLEQLRRNHARALWPTAGGSPGPKRAPPGAGGTGQGTRLREARETHGPLDQGPGTHHH